jgi:hypothetical protein
MARNVCVTWNNYQEDALEKLKRWDQVSFAVFGQEESQEGTPHLQGYVELVATKKWKTLQNKMPGSHLEARYGNATAAQAAAYCRKGKQTKEEWKELRTAGPNYGLDAVVTEWGTPSEQGARTDLTQAVEMVKEGKRMREVAEECPGPYTKYHKGLTALQAILIQPRNEVPEVRVYWGATGSGKSRKAREWLSEEKYVWWPQQEKWFCGYAGEKEVLFEEFRGQLPFGMLLSLLDRYDSKVQYKGGMIQFTGTKIALTSPLHPKDWYYLDGPDSIQQLMRRITLVEHCQGPEMLIMVDQQHDRQDLLV